MSDDQLFREVDEEVRRDRFEALLKRYGKFVAGGIALVAILGIAFVLWLQLQERRGLEAGAQFSAAVQLVADGELEQAADEFAVLAETAKPGYRMLARLRQAALLIELGDTDEAIAVYDGVAADSSVDRVYRDLAVLLSVTHQADDGDPATLTDRLADLNDGTNPWRFSAKELLGVIAIRSGDTQRARELFAELSGDLDAPPGVRARAAELLAALGG